MSVNSQTKRRSALGMTLMFLVIAPLADGTVVAVDREHIIGIYAGIPPTSPAVSTDHIHIFSTGTVEPTRVADIGNNVLFAGDIEVQGNTYTKGFVGNLVAKTGNYTVVTSDYSIICDATSAGFTVTLPVVASHTGRIYHIKKIDSSGNTVTVDGNSSETIDDTTTAVLTAQYESITIQSDGSEWWVL